MADIFDVVADPTRRELLTRLLEVAEDPGSARGEISVGELVAALGISQPTVSKHLKVLREHGLVQVREEGQHRYYRLDGSPLGELDRWIAPFADRLGGRAGADDPAVGDEGDTVYAAAFAAWAGAEQAGSRLGRAAAETAHTARSVVHDAQERIQGAQERLQEGVARITGRS
ncbi:ArsR/SmtB family transcription factor [Homoserinibacter sp. YIM 151385]|uniref:ArsR/SmtB family transcription factor n=1 Tax=Homoserinibacter sp. YIM 151385 TaxID=2985506 RepID=UPI0022F0BC91|nr:metalloregulator ArsR/SmtB family transcription factor [Homoserinibacter sp. YIM 151385]WBU37028.1 metalloregulator ArsR/SmtB family transcription factor [Homoserinibacter sp. YIM 151385]